MDSKDPLICFLPLGAIIQKFTVDGQNIVLGFPSEDLYRKHSDVYFGETVGRFANRLSNGLVRQLNGRDYTFAKNENGRTTLHGGVRGWGKHRWDGPMRVLRHGREVTKFMLWSRDGDEGFPGEVMATVYYGVQANAAKQSDSRVREEVILDVEYEAEMVGNEADIHETIVAIINHSYFNLSSGPTIAGTQVTFATDLHLTMDADGIPNRGIKQHPLVRKEVPIVLGAEGPVFDDCFVLNEISESVALDTRDRPMSTAVSLVHPDTKLHLTIETTEPSFMFYTGDNIDVKPQAGFSRGCHQDEFGPRSGVAIEPNRYVDAANHHRWRHMVLLQKGQVWGSRSRYRAWRER